MGIAWQRSTLFCYSIVNILLPLKNGGIYQCVPRFRESLFLWINSQLLVSECYYPIIWPLAPIHPCTPQITPTLTTSPTGPLHGVGTHSVPMNSVCTTAVYSTYPSSLCHCIDVSFSDGEFRFAFSDCEFRFAWEAAVKFCIQYSSTIGKMTVHVQYEGGVVYFVCVCANVWRVRDM